MPLAVKYFFKKFLQNISLLFFFSIFYYFFFLLFARKLLLLNNLQAKWEKKRQRSRKKEFFALIFQSSRASILKRAVEYIMIMKKQISEDQDDIEKLKLKNEQLEAQGLLFAFLLFFTQHFSLYSIY